MLSKSIWLAERKLCGKEGQHFCFDAISNATRMRPFVSFEGVAYAIGFEPFVEVARSGQKIILEPNVKRNRPEASKIGHVLI